MNQPPEPSGAGLSLVDIAQRTNPVRDLASKVDHYYETYEPYFSALRDRRISILELGVYEGQSTKVFSRYFPNASIIAVDITLKDIDFSEYPNVLYLQANQTDAGQLAAIVAEHAPDGLDIIIDDASHIGWYSQLSLMHLFPHLVRGGLYVIEDWGTGYQAAWPDGSAYQRYDVAAAGEDIPARIPSHDNGMVGFIKWLVDLVGAGDIGGEGAVTSIGPRPVRFLHVYPSTAVLKK
jgi:hypothetical protein